MRVLVVEDDRSLGMFLIKGLELEGHRVEWVGDGEAALAHSAVNHSDLVLLDLSLPKRDGMEVLAEMRTRHDDASVLVLSGRNELSARVQCLDMGADDYLAKPFSYLELKARCRALLRRRQQFADPVLRHGDVELHRIEHKVTRGGREISLTVTEFSLLEYFLMHEGECISRGQLLAEVWRMPDQTVTNLVDVYVNYLRRKVDDPHANPLYGGLIETVRGSGYRLGGIGRMPAMRQSIAANSMVGLAYA